MALIGVGRRKSKRTYGVIVVVVVIVVEVEMLVPSVVNLANKVACRFNPVFWPSGATEIAKLVAGVKS